MKGGNLDIKLLKLQAEQIKSGQDLKLFLFELAQRDRAISIRLNEIKRANKQGGE